MGMADDPGNSASANIADPLAAAKANLRDTVKWLATTLAALAAVIIAGTSFTGLARLSGGELRLALAGGALAIIAVLLVIALLLRLLMSEAFYFGDLFDPKNANVLAALEPHAVELLPPTIRTIVELGEVRQRAVEKVRSSVGTPTYDESVRYLDSLRPILASVTYFGQFERMRQRLRRESIPLLVLTLVGIAGLALLVVAVGKGGQASATAPPITNIVYPPPPSAGPPAPVSDAARDAAIRVLLTEAIRVNEKAGTLKQGPTVTLHPILDLIHGLTTAGVMTAGEADSLTKDLRSNAIEGGRELLVHAGDRIIDSLFPPETTPSAAPPINISVSGCCGRCQATTTRHKRKKSTTPKTPKTPVKPVAAASCLKASPSPQQPPHSGGGGAGPVHDE